MKIFYFYFCKCTNEHNLIARIYIMIDIVRVCINVMYTHNPCMTGLRQKNYKYSKIRMKAPKGIRMEYLLFYLPLEATSLHPSPYCGLSRNQFET